MNFEQQIQGESFLFRYREVNQNNINALENNRLYFSTPANFNDPYDNLVYANTFQIMQHVYGNIHKGMDGYLNKLKEKNPMAAGVGYVFWNGEKREEYLHDFIEEIISCVDHIKKSVRRNTKIICFSKVYNSMLMWSHYADNHKGFLLAYDMQDIKSAERFNVNDEIINNKTYLGEVSYVSNQLDLSDDIEDYVRYNMMPTLGDVETQDIKISAIKLREFMLQKSVEWEYEREWRLIPRIISLEQESPLGYINCIPKAVILGAHCSKEDTIAINEIAKKKNISVYRMYLDELSPAFRLNVGDGRDYKVI